MSSSHRGTTCGVGGEVISEGRCGRRSSAAQSVWNYSLDKKVDSELSLVACPGPLFASTTHLAAGCVVQRSNTDDLRLLSQSGDNAAHFNLSRRTVQRLWKRRFHAFLKPIVHRLRPPKKPSEFTSLRALRTSPTVSIRIVDNS